MNNKKILLITIVLPILVSLWLFWENSAGRREFTQAINLPLTSEYQISICKYDSDRQLFQIEDPAEQRQILQAVRNLEYGGITVSTPISPDDNAYDLNIWNQDASLSILISPNDKLNKLLIGDGLKIANPEELYQLTNQIFNAHQTE